MLFVYGVVNDVDVVDAVVYGGAAVAVAVVAVAGVVGNNHPAGPSPSLLVYPGFLLVEWSFRPLCLSDKTTTTTEVKEFGQEKERRKKRRVTTLNKHSAQTRRREEDLAVGCC